jgi:hypothetical protein
MKMKARSSPSTGNTGVLWELRVAVT